MRHGGHSVGPGTCHRRQAQQPAAFVRAPDALERVTWRTRTIVGDDRLTNWKLRDPRRARRSHLPRCRRPRRCGGRRLRRRLEHAAVERAAPEDRSTPRSRPPRSRDLRARMGPVRTADVTASSRLGRRRRGERLFAFAKAMGADTIVVPRQPPLLALDALADELGINVAVLRRPGNAARVRRRSKAAASGSASASTRALGAGGVSPRDGLAAPRPARLPEPA